MPALSALVKRQGRGGVQYDLESHFILAALCVALCCAVCGGGAVCVSRCVAVDALFVTVSTAALSCYLGRPLFQKVVVEIAFAIARCLIVAHFRIAITQYIK